MSVISPTANKRKKVHASLRTYVITSLIRPSFFALVTLSKALALYELGKEIDGFIFRKNNRALMTQRTFAKSESPQ